MGLGGRGGLAVRAAGPERQVPAEEVPRACGQPQVGHTGRTQSHLSMKVPRGQKSVTDSV